jgi:uncharacterized protein (DUF1697 family)
MEKLMRYAAFMRGLNLGKRNVKMEDLKKIFVKAGFTNVESFIASGNIVLTSASTDRAAMEKKIELAIEKAYGYVSETFIRDFAELAKIGKAMPFKGIEDAPTYLVGLLKEPLDAAGKKRFMALASPRDQFAVSGREVWWYSENSQADSKFSANAFDKALGVRSTWRNLRTVRRMVDRWGSGG